MIPRIACLVIGYCFGLFQTSYFYGKTQGVDIRKLGSGNAGTTNALRSLGAKAGVITLIGDICKCLLAVLVTWLLFGKAHAELYPLLKVWTAAGVILGHDFPFYMNFKGGKGIAATAGMVFSFGDWRMIVVGVASFLLILALTHYVSLSSIVFSLQFLVGVVAFSLMGHYQMIAPRLVEMCVMVGALVALNIYQHRANIVRLAQGCERKTYLTKKSDV